MTIAEPNSLPSWANRLLKFFEAEEHPISQSGLRYWLMREHIETVNQQPGRLMRGRVPPIVRNV